jgi:hypothetical protein
MVALHTLEEIGSERTEYMSTHTTGNSAVDVQADSNCAPAVYKLYQKVWEQLGSNR